MAGTIVAVTPITTAVDRRSIKEWCEKSCGVNVAYVDYIPGTPKAVIRMKTKIEASRLMEGTSSCRSSIMTTKLASSHDVMDDM